MPLSDGEVGLDGAWTDMDLAAALLPELQRDLADGGPDDETELTRARERLPSERQLWVLIPITAVLRDFFARPPTPVYFSLVFIVLLFI